MESLLHQDYPKEFLEIIIVDNNSSDITKEIAKLYTIKLLEEKKVQSSYAARNKGIGMAKGEVMVLVDSDCVVTPEWLREGTKAMFYNSADIVAGNVKFTLSNKKPFSEMTPLDKIKI